MRSCVTCPLCGRSIFSDHNLSDKNYDEHVRACPDQQARRRRIAAKQYRREITRGVKKYGGCIPMAGQLRLPYVEGVPEVVEE
jgi:hypothetical protein